MRFGSGFRLLSVGCIVACVSGRTLAQVPAPQTPASPAPPAAAQPAPAQPAAPAQTAASPAAAPPAAAEAEPSLEAKERARSAYARGQAAFAQGDFAAAQSAFEEAYANVPNPIVLLSIAESAAKQQRIEPALAAYDTYLQKRPDAPDREEIAQKRAALAQTPAELTLLSEPQGADITVDGQSTGRRTPAILQVSPGDHTIVAVLAGYAGEPLPLTVAPGAKGQHMLKLKEPPPPPVAAAPSAPETPVQPEKAQPPTAALVVTGSLGAAGLIAGTVLGILALSERSDYDKQPTEAGADRGERLALFADVGFGVGAMALVTTAVLLLTHDDVKSPEPGPQTSRLELIPSITARGASATAKVRF